MKKKNNFNEYTPKTSDRALTKISVILSTTIYITHAVLLLLTVMLAASVIMFSNFGSTLASGILAIFSVKTEQLSLIPAIYSVLVCSSGALVFCILCLVRQGKLFRYALIPPNDFIVKKGSRRLYYVFCFIYTAFIIAGAVSVFAAKKGGLGYSANALAVSLLIGAAVLVIFAFLEYADALKTLKKVAAEQSRDIY